jgi:hypothetical protein
MLALSAIRTLVASQKLGTIHAQLMLCRHVDGQVKRERLANLQHHQHLLDNWRDFSAYDHFAYV